MKVDISHLTDADVCDLLKISKIFGETFEFVELKQMMAPFDTFFTFRCF